MSFQIVKYVERLAEDKCQEIVDDITRTMIGEAPVYTGEVKSSIRADRISKWKWRIGPHTDHDYWAEYGNHANNADGRIHPVRKKALAFTTNHGERVVTGSVRPHKGSHFVRKTADKYR